MKIYSAHHRAIVEAPIMDLYEHYKNGDYKAYNQWTESHIPVLPEHQALFKDGQEVENDIDYGVEGRWIIKPEDRYPNGDHKGIKTFVTVAIPIKQQVSEEDKPTWKESQDQMNRPLGPSGYEPLQVSEEPTGEYYTIDYWEKRATHFEAEFDAANKEVLYLQEKQSALKKWVIEQRNLAHVNCLEETKQAYNNVIAYLESATSQVSVEDKEPLPQQEGDGWKQLTYRALYNSLQREKTLQSQLSEALQGLEKWSNKFAEQRAKYLESLQTIKSQEAEIEKLQEVWKVKDETIETLVSRISELELEIAEGTGLVEFLDMENQRLKAELRKHLK